MTKLFVLSDLGNIHATVLQGVNLCGCLLVTRGKPGWDLAAECTSKCGVTICCEHLTNQYKNQTYMYESTLRRLLCSYLTTKIKREIATSFPSFFQALLLLGQAKPVTGLLFLCVQGRSCSVQENIAHLLLGGCRPAKPHKADTPHEGVALHSQGGESVLTLVSMIYTLVLA